MLCLSVWLIAQGVIQLLQISFPLAGPLMAALAIAAGVLLLMKK
jgi:uncharacterized protein YhhL (DUF1145 family)